LENWTLKFIWLLKIGYWLLINEENMLLNKIGEFGLIERFRKNIKTDSSVIVGSGDDCAVLEFDKNNYQLFTCDMIVEGVDFTLKDNLYLVGRKALGISLSDIAACGGIPRWAVVSLGLPKNSTVKDMDKLSQGLFDLAKEYKVNIVGGDISSAPKLTIDVSLIGIVKKKNLVLRSGAKAGDVIVVSGTLGGSIKGKHLKFIPRVKEANFLVNSFKVNAMIDISDGLLQDLSHILKQSKVGAAIFEPLIPKDKECKDSQDALAGGEDFELLFTMSRHDVLKLAGKNNNFYFKPIGQVMPEGFGLKVFDKDNNIIKLPVKGFEHF